MTDRKELVRAIEGIVAGYVFLHFDINLFVVNILPDWIGYLAMLHVFDVLGEEEPSVKLLKPIGGILLAREFVEIFSRLIGYEINLQLIGMVITVIELYFHFQLLTNLADIAKKYDYPKHQNIINLRTVRTILITAFAVMPLSWEAHKWLVTCFGIIGIVVGIWICVELNAFRKALEEGSTDNRLENDA